MRGPRALERLRYLDDATRRMTETLDYERTLETVAEVAVPMLGDTAFVEVVEGDEVRRVPDGRDGRDGRELRDTREPSAASSSATAALVADGERLGFLTVKHVASNRRHSEHDIALLDELAARAAVAIRNARLYGHALDTARHCEHATRQAEEASRLKDEFLAMVSHELRTPLSSILGWTSVLNNDLSLAPKGIEIIERNARVQQRIVDDMLDVSRIIAGKLRLDTEPVDLAVLAREVLESFRPAGSAKQIELMFASTEASCRLAGDGARLRQVVTNLLSNAIKFTPEGGRVWLEVERLGDRVVLRMTDTGRGIDPAFLPHVFERFSQGDVTSATRSRGGGLGLGLAIVRHLVDIHGGSIEVSSQGAGRGATFTVTLPVKPFSAPVRKARSSDATTSTSASPSSRQNRLVGLRVLVVEDEADSRELIELLLESEGAVVHAAESADAAVNALGSFCADVVLSDIGMPGRDGYWLAGEIRRRAPGVPAIALTAYATEEDIRRASDAGFVHHVGKPVDPEHLVSALIRLRRTTPTTDRTDRTTTAA